MVSGSVIMSSINWIRRGPPPLGGGGIFVGVCGGKWWGVGGRGVFL
jgi:hypothetical protein